MFLYIFFALFFLSAEPVTDATVRIGLGDSYGKVKISCDGSFKMALKDSSKHKTLKKKKEYLVYIKDGQLLLDGEKLGQEIRLDCEEEFLRLNGRRYRDSLILRSKNGKVQVVNELGLSGYLYGVIPKEVSPSWPGEVLKAQAVVSRTYVLNNLGKDCENGYDICSTYLSQVYGGVEAEDPRSTLAVEETGEEVIYYRDSPARVYFHSNSGGYTAGPDEVWEKGTRFPYLRARPDPYSEDSPNYFWQTKISKESLSEALKKEGHKVAKIKKIVPREKTPSGRAKLFLVKAKGGDIQIPGNRFRSLCGMDKVRSTLIVSMKESGEWIIIEGRGWGHGVGMSQWGARSMALAGKKYKDIIEFYFPETKVKKISGLPGKK